jgi:hypothetical protein
MYFEDDQSLVDAKKEKLKEYWKSQKGNKKSNLDHSIPGNGARKRGLLTVNSCIKFRL